MLRFLNISNEFKFLIKPAVINMLKQICTLTLRMILRITPLFATIPLPRSVRQFAEIL